jgi:ribosomal protein S27E
MPVELRVIIVIRQRKIWKRASAYLLACGKNARMIVIFATVSVVITCPQCLRTFAEYRMG